MLAIKYLFMSLLLFSCTLLRVAPRPNIVEIKYTEGSILDGKYFNLILSDERKKKEHSRELMLIFENILKKQIRSLGGGLTSGSQVLHFSLRSYDIAQSNTGCTVILSYSLSFRGKTKKSVVTDDYFPCVDKTTKEELASSTISLMLKEVSSLLEKTESLK